MADILVLGCGQVGGKVISKIENLKDINVYCFARNKNQEYKNTTFITSYKTMLKPDILVEALPGKTNIDVEFSYAILKKYLENGISSISCNKMLIQRKGKELCRIARENNTNLMLSSIMAVDSVKIDQNNFDKFGEEIYTFRGKNSEETSNSIVRDINILMEVL